MHVQNPRLMDIGGGTGLAAGWRRPISVAGAYADPAVRKAAQSNPALAALPEQDRQMLLRLARIKTVKRLETICRQGDPAVHVVLFLEGHAKLSRPQIDGGEVFLGFAGPGDCVGETSVTRRAPHDADVTALSPCRLLSIDAREFRETFERRPDGLLAILGLAADRLRQVTEQLEDRCALPAPARLAKALVRLARTPVPGSNSEAGIALRLSQAELGTISGMCREFVCKHLGLWRDAGWIRMANGAVTAVRTSALLDLPAATMDHSAGNARLPA